TSVSGITSFQIGSLVALEAGSYNRYHGLIDDFRIYKTELSASEIRDLYALAGSGKASSPSPSNAATSVDTDTPLTLTWTPGDWAAGDRGLAALPGREAEFAAGLDKARLTVNVRGPGWHLRDPGEDGWRKCRQFNPLGLGAPRPTSVKPYLVRLHFAELDPLRPGGRVFDVKVQGKVVLKAFDPVKVAGGPLRAIVREFKAIPAGDTLAIELVPVAGAEPALNAIEVLADGW
ncbi:hypothetical protein LCGC14_1756120, partial [marine sediment metagenome]